MTKLDRSCAAACSSCRRRQAKPPKRCGGSVSDQICALKELAALVSESGATYDVAEPTPLAAATTAVAGPRFESPQPRVMEGVRRVEAPSPREAARPRGPEAIAAPVIEPGAPALIAAADLGLAAGRRPALSWPGAARRPIAAGRESGDFSARAGVRPRPGGSLSNLLAAASRDEPEAASPRGAGTFEALTLEIAGFIDNAAAMEMWERWRRGDAAAISRRLYTEAGQQAFDEIRRRYRADPQFRDTTMRYMQEFERLLAKLDQNHRDGSQWRAYLMSNTGKVYTILAHASGRLG